MDKKLCVLITCFNRKNKTIECLQILYRVSNSFINLSIDIYLVDDGSTDGTSDAILKLFPNVNLIFGDGNLFWNRGMNKAWGIASTICYDFYLWLNDDTHLHENSFYSLFEDSSLFDDTAIICGACESTDKSTVTYSGYTIKDKVQIKPSGVPIICDYFNGNVVLIPKHVFNIVGFLDPFFHHSLGDIDYGLRAKKYGIKSFVTSSIVATCDRHNELPVWCNPKYTLFKRLKYFRSPLSKKPIQIFYIEYKHFNVFTAFFRSSIIFLRLVFPSIWVKLGIAKI